MHGPMTKGYRSIPLAMTITKKMLEATTNVIKSMALETIVPLIAHMHARAEWADAGNPPD